MDLSREKQTKRYWSRRDFANLLVLADTAKTRITSSQAVAVAVVVNTATTGITLATAKSRTRHVDLLAQGLEISRNMNWSPLLMNWSPYANMNQLEKVRYIFLDLRNNFSSIEIPGIYSICLYRRENRVKLISDMQPSSPRCNTWILRGLSEIVLLGESCKQVDGFWCRVGKS